MYGAIRGMPECAQSPPARMLTTRAMISSSLAMSTVIVAVSAVQLQPMTSLPTTCAGTVEPVRVGIWDEGVLSRPSPAIDCAIRNLRHWGRGRKLLKARTVSISSSRARFLSSKSSS